EAGIITVDDATRPNWRGDGRQASGEKVEHLDIGTGTRKHRVNGDIGPGIRFVGHGVAHSAEKPDVGRNSRSKTLREGLVAGTTDDDKRHLRVNWRQLIEDHADGFHIGWIGTADEQCHESLNSYILPR